MTDTVQDVIRNLARNNMAGYHVSDRAALFPLLQALIPSGSSVGCGDSVTLEDTGVFAFLRRGPYMFYDKHAPGLSSAEKHALYVKNFDADTFVTSTNAITRGGELVNIDGNGSRVAPMIYGPRQVLVIAGSNKITEDLSTAIARARQVAAPLDAAAWANRRPASRRASAVIATIRREFATASSALRASGRRIASK